MIPALVRQYLSAQPGKRRQIFLSLPVEYSLPEWSYHCFAYTIDIGESGLSMHIPQKFEQGQSLRLKIYYEESSGAHCLEVLGEVTRVDSFEKPEKGFRCFVSFFGIPSELNKKLEQFLKSFY